MSKRANLNWYINRLKLMNPAEICYRLYISGYSKYEKIFEKKLIKKAKTYKGLNNFYFNKNDIEAIKKYYQDNPSEYQELINSSNNILENKFTFFSFKNKEFDNEINWQKDYLSNKECPLNFYTKINYRNFEETGNPKYIWEINRFQHFYPLSIAYCLTGDKKYADYMVKQIEDWINKNHYLRGINWTSCIELALRIMSWGWALYSLQLCGYEIPRAIKDKIGKSIYLQADYIYHHISKFSSANNHLLAEGAGLLCVSVLFDFGKDSLKWRDKGFDILTNEIEEQTYEDGMNKEQAMEYHCFVFDLFLSSFLLAEKNNVKIPENCWKILEKMANVLSLFSEELLKVPHFGDADGGYVIKIKKEETLKSIFNTSAVIFNKGQYKYNSGNSFDVKTLWLLGKNGFEKFKNINVEYPKQKSFFLKDSGYLLLKYAKVKGFIDVGSLGFLSIAAHGHADALSFCLNYENKDFLIDPGTYNYFTPKYWRDYFRGTAAHNTLLVDNQNQSLIGGSFMWLKKAETKVEKIIINDSFDYVRASHNGYIKQAIPVNHTRELLFKKDKFILILDRAFSSDDKNHNYCLNWHLSEKCELLDKSDCFEIKNNETSIYLNSFCNTDTIKEVFKGSLNPIAGWLSRDFDDKIPTNTIKVNAESNKPVNFITLFTFSERQKINYANNILTINILDKEYSYNLENYLK